MALENYGLLKGWVVKRKQAHGNRPHYQVLVKDSRKYFRVSINVASYTKPPDLKYFIDEDFSHPIIDSMLKYKPGFTPIKTEPDGDALDYIRGNYFNLHEMQILPHERPGPNNDLNEKFDSEILPAIGDKKSMIYVFGERWGPFQNERDDFFNFKPDNGMHDVHMNQANSRSFKNHDGVWQDGAVFIHYPGLKRWIAIFLAFQSQGVYSDDKYGHIINTAGTLAGVVKIVSAQIKTNAENSGQSVTILNRATQAVNLQGWSLINTARDSYPLRGILKSGAAKKIKLPDRFKLTQAGGIVSLLDQQGLKIDGAAYRTSEIADPGWSITF